MDILFVSSEVAPFSKTGGLGDVGGALPRALAARGHRVAVVTPRYGSIDPAARKLERLPHGLSAGGHGFALWRAPGPAPVYLVEHEHFFGNRRAPYGEHGRDYPDNAERFAFLARAALAVPRAIGLSPDVVHANDWQTGLVPWLLSHEFFGQPWAPRSRTVFTIHNLAYQGVFAADAVQRVGLPPHVLRTEAMEFHGALSFMKAGLVYSDALTTVSPNYAREIQGWEMGEGLDGLLRHRSHRLTGILNGIDQEEWDPSKDRFLKASYARGDLAGKALCKEAVQRELGLPVRADVPLVAMVGRLAEQKGIDLVTAALGEILGMDVQVGLLGSGRHDWEELFRRVARERPDRIAARIGFDEGLAHRLEAGADLFLMPSRFEPCGLNQMYSLRYGTVPVVRATGGLEDTVVDYDGAGGGTGFKFAEYHPGALLAALRRAVETFRDRAAWAGIVDRGMAQDFSWAAAAAQYEALYARLR